jgi:outer membrane receptor protein involved in Fe transport
MSTASVLAQSDIEGKTSAPPSSALEEIVVTASKREQKLNDVGLAITALSGDTLKTLQINSLADIANAVPGLSYANTSTGTPVYTLRGIGFYEQSLGSYPAVSVYLDQIPLSFPVLTRHIAYDLERLEVLKGPQGTLFGENSTGGAINYIVAKPQDHFAAGAELTYGRFSELDTEMFVTGPLAPTLNARFAGRVETADGWQLSNSRPGDTNGKTRNYMGRLQLAFEPADRMRFLLNVNGSEDRSDTQAPQIISLNVQNPFASPALLASSLSRQTPRAADWTPGDTFGGNHQWQASLRGDIGVADGITATILSSYMNYQQHQAEDDDGLPISDYDTPSDSGNISSFNQELRFANDSSNSLRWVGGANYEKSDVDEYSNLFYPEASSGTTLGVVYGYPISRSFFYSDQKFKSYALFGNVEDDIAGNLTLKGGVRYTNAQDADRSCHGDSSGLPHGTGPFFYDVLLGGAFGKFVPGSCFIINDQSAPIGGVAPGAPGEFKDALREHNVSWTLGADWKVRPGMLIYANAAKGYKAGSFPTAAGSVYVSYLPVKQESVMSYEIGTKLTFLDRRLQFNAAAFYYDYKDKQLRSKDLELPFGILDVLQNIPKSSAKGFEFEIQALPISGLSINTAFTYLDATIDKFSGINAAGVAADFADTNTPFTPKFEVSSNIDYKFPIFNALNAFIGTSVTFRSKTDSVVGGELNPPTASVQGEPLFAIKAYTLVDLRAGIESADGHWRAALWGKNVLNGYYWNNAVSVFDTVSRYTGKPATFGVTVGYRF